ncbi:hypothetical protein AVEN_71690-1 [Araneus ventricosus]|uniref:Uncharacterized protein n=1 Tax=Araneus ventricosus TaxID=182803 RepID=A0A4Y2FGC0_ARAVE|nr:hypothetical protein AVEN_71690-1 [Araneus ventricosus]
MEDAKVLRAHCWSTYLCECLCQFHCRNTVDYVSHLTSTEHEPFQLGLDFLFHRGHSLDLYVHHQLHSNPDAPVVLSFLSGNMLLLITSIVFTW